MGGQQREVVPPQLGVEKGDVKACVVGHERHVTDEG
jgi:hypothetical protein